LLSIARDIHILRDLGIREECISTYRICCTVLQVGAAKGLTLKHLGDILVRFPDGDYCDKLGPLAPQSFERRDSDDTSTLERLVALAKLGAEEKMSKLSQQPPVAETDLFGDVEMEVFAQLFHSYSTALVSAQSTDRPPSPLRTVPIDSASSLPCSMASSQSRALEGMPIQRQQAVGVGLLP
jgi:hypothetical protein